MVVVSLCDFVLVMSTIRPAGLGNRKSGETAARALMSDHVEVGGHSGKIKSVSDSICHGVPTVKKESVEKTFKAMEQTEIEKVLNDKKEKIYKSRKAEPLGKFPMKGYTLPPEDFRFGKHGEKHEYGIKEIVNPVDDIVESDEVKEMYRKTHRDFAPGEQLRREYNWPVKDGQAFGLCEEKSSSGIEAAMKWDASEDVTKVHSKRLQAYRVANHDEVGRSKNLLQGLMPVPPGFRFGSKSVNQGETAAEAIHRNYANETELLPDKYVGKSPIRKPFSS